MADQTKGAEDGLDKLFCFLSPEQEAEVNEVLKNKTLPEFKIQSLLSTEQKEQMQRILNKKWFFQRPLHGFPLERPVKLIEKFMKTRFYTVEPNVHEAIREQDDALNNMMVEDNELYFNLMSGRRVVEDEGNSCTEKSVLSEHQHNQLNELLESEEEANKKYLEEHPEVEGIVGVLFSNLCYYRPPDPLEFTNTLFGSCEHCLRGNISSYLEYKKKPKRVDLLDTITSNQEPTDWRKVWRRLEDNERERKEEEQFKQSLEEGNEDDLTKAYKKVIQKKMNEFGGNIIDSILDDIIAKEEAVENKTKMIVVKQIIDLVLEEIFGEGKTEEDIKVLREKSNEISENVIDGVLSKVFNEVEEREKLNVQERKSEMITNIIEIVVEQVIQEVEDNEILKIIEDNKSNIMLEIIESVFDKIFGEPVKLEDRMTFTELDVIMKAMDKLMGCRVEEERKTRITVGDDHVIF